jgi:hypothetical protein
VPERMAAVAYNCLWRLPIVCGELPGCGGCRQQLSHQVAAIAGCSEVCRAALAVKLCSAVYLSACHVWPAAYLSSEMLSVCAQLHLMLV